MKEMVGGCCVCSDDRGWPENPLVYCDGQSCTVAVHQACYGIVTVPTGPWYCRKCESQERSVKVKCELCPSKYGALKRTDNSGWAHVVCALYIPEVRFGNVTTMEPIQLQLIPQERFSKVCYICEENGKPANAGVGACMQCNRSGCKQQFHVTCAQSLGLLCEEAGNYLDNVKYCGYCQYHYSKLKKGGNVKTIPPYKPVAAENQQSDSSSEKESEAAAAAAAAAALKAPPPVTTGPGKRKTGAGGKSSASKVSSTSNAKSVPSYQKQSSSNKVADKSGKSSSSAKSAKSTDEGLTADSDKTEKKDAEIEKSEVKDTSGKGKKRKANSRTPTPNIVVSETNPVVPESANPVNPVQKKESPARTDTVEKTKKAKTDPPPNQQLSVSTVTPQSTNPVNTAIASTASPITAATAETVPIVVTTTTASSVTQSTTTQVVNSVVVSVPLVNTSLSPHAGTAQPIINPPLVPSQAGPPEEKKQPTPVPTSPTEESMITSEMSGGGLKITFEKQPSSTTTVVPMELEEPLPATVPAEIPSKRSRSQSAEKFVEKQTRESRSKKKNSNGLMNAVASAVGTSKRSSRSQHSTPPPQQSTSFVNLPQSGQIKESPPSSPSSESLGAPPIGRKKGRKSAPASVSSSSNSNSNNSNADLKDAKDIKLFQNGVNAPHMLGNQLNLNSNMAQKMSDHLNSELEAHSIFNSSEASTNLIGPQLHHRVIASARSSSTGGSSTASAGSGLSSMLGGSGGTIPQTLDQLLERQWEQGSQFLMEQAQHFDIASLLSCLHQLRAENLRLEEHVSSLLQRRDHLLAVNARLAIPLTGPPVAPQASHPHTVNNIHPQVAATHADAPPSRSRHSSSSYSSHVQPPQQVNQHPSGSVENGISPEQAYPHSHRSPATNPPQQSPNVRQPSGGYSSGAGLMRQGTESNGRSAPRPHSYSMYQGSSNSQQQMVIRRDNDPQHQSTSKPS